MKKLHRHELRTLLLFYYWKGFSLYLQTFCYVVGRGRGCILITHSKSCLCFILVKINPDFRIKANKVENFQRKQIRQIGSKRTRRELGKTLLRPGFTKCSQLILELISKLFKGCQLQINQKYFPKSLLHFFCSTQSQFSTVKSPLSSDFHFLFLLTPCFHEKIFPLYKEKRNSSVKNFLKITYGSVLETVSPASVLQSTGFSSSYLSYLSTVS